jgi:hypothetical protein
MGLPEIFECSEREGGFVRISMIELAFFDASMFANGGDGTPAVALLPHQFAESGLELFGSVRGAAHAGLLLDHLVK